LNHITQSFRGEARRAENPETITPGGGYRFRGRRFAAPWNDKVLGIDALPAVLVEAAPAGVRCTAVALGYNLCFGLFGGLSPLVATWLVERAGNEIAPAFLIMASAAVTFVTIFYFRESYRIQFDVVPNTAAV